MVQLKINLFLILLRTTVFPCIVDVVTYVTLFETNKRDVSEGSTFKKYDHTLVELSDNGMYLKVQPVKNFTLHWLNFLLPENLRCSFVL